MTKWITIAKHEYSYNVRRKEFLFVTFGLPLFMFAIIGLPILLAASSLGPEELKIGFVDRTGSFEKANFTRYADEGLAKKALLEGKITHFFIIPSDYRATGKIEIFSAKKEFPGPGNLEAQIRSFLLDNLLKAQAKDTIERVKNPMKSEHFTMNEKGETSAENISGFLISIAFALFFMLSIFTSSNFLLQGVVEEKENRVIEILLSSVSHRELLTGKIFGLGAVGLTQIIIWQIIGIGILSSGPISLLLSSTNISIPLLIFASGYFILGYLVFACIMAGVGAVASTPREGQQMAGVFTITGAIPLIISQFVIANPDAILTKALSYFPLTSPITMIMRLSTGGVQYYEVVLSLVILTVSILVIIELSVKVFRASLLMYGKKPTLREIIRYMRETSSKGAP